MGQGGSVEFKEAFQTTVGQLSQVQLAEIGSRYNELYKQAGGGRGKIIDREKFSEYFNLPVALGDRLFDAFDKKQNDSIDFEEFVCGLAILTHGSFTDKCGLLFQIFNLAGDEGVSRAELYSLIHAVVTSTNTILLTLTEGGQPGRNNSPISDPETAVKNLVDTAFRNCDISRSGKLLPLEFEYWIKRNPKILDFLLPSVDDPEEIDTPTLVPLLFVPIDNDDTDGGVVDNTLEESTTIVDNLTSVQLESGDVVIDMEGGIYEEERNGEDGKIEEEEEEGLVAGTTEPPPSPTEKEEIVENIVGIEENGDEMIKEEEELVAGTTEPPPTPTEKKEIFLSEIENNVEMKENGDEMVKEEEELVAMTTKLSTNEEENGLMGEEENIVVERETERRPEEININEEHNKPRSTSNMSATEETIQLARALSESLTSPVVEDTPSLVVSDDGTSKVVSERILSAWLPSTLVETMLASGRKVSPEYLTQPGLIAQTGKYDAIAEVLLTTFPGTTRRQQVTVDQVKLNEEGLHILLQNGCYHGALDLTAQFLSAHGQGLGQAGQMAMHTHKTLQMWYVRLTLLYSLGRYEEVEEEFKAFKELDQPDLYYQYDKRQYPDKVGSMVLFPMRLLHSQLPLHFNNTQLALNRTCLLQNTTQKILDLVKQGRLPLSEEELSPDERGVAEEVWLTRLVHVKFALCRCLLALGNYFLVKTILEEVLQLIPEQKIEVLSALGRLCLLYGDFGSANNYFTMASLISSDQDSVLNTINRSFIDLYQNQWGNSEQGFLGAFNSDPSVTLNNATVCAVHQQRLTEAITQLEEHIKTTPTNNLNSSLFFSLFSCYDLESSQSQAKKLSWLPYLGHHAPEGFNMVSLGLVT